MDYGSNTYLVLKSFHIIFMVSYFAGLFYLIRLFVYHREAENSTHPDVLQRQFEIMIRKLWNIIIAPAGVIMLITGLMLLTASHMYLIKQPWMHIKLTLLLLFLGMHLFAWRESKTIVTRRKGQYNALQYRKWNEVPTLFLFAIVFVVVLKQHIFEIYPKLIIGFLVILVLIFGIIKMVNRKK